MSGGSKWLNAVDRCGALKRNGGRCRRAVVKWGRCKLHGGGTPPDVCPADREWRYKHWGDVVGKFHYWYDNETPISWEGTLLKWEALAFSPTRFANRKLLRDTLSKLRTPYREDPLDTELEVEYRLATSQDLAGFVIPSWLQSYARSLVAKLLRADGRYSTGRDIYWSSQRKRIETLLATAGTRVTVATVADTGVGWSCEDRSRRVLHYVYVKDAFRRQGIGTALVGWANDASHGVVRLTHIPPPWYSRPQNVNVDGKLGVKNLWAPHVVIDLINEI